MTCFNPLTAWRSKGAPNPKTGLRAIVFDVKNGNTEESIQIPCGQCLGCRLERSKQWAIRCMHEARMHENNCFVTLTYNNWNLDKYCKKGDVYSLNKREFVLFMKRLRKAFPENIIKFFHAGEYGEKYSRPHHHVCIFGMHFPDKIPWKKSGDIILYRSPKLEKIWVHGYSSIGDVNWETACYVAKYVTKKITGPNADRHYSGRNPEYVTMSRNPGIGKKFLQEFMTDIYNHDKVIINGHECRPPRYYDQIYDIDNHEKLQAFKQERINKIDQKNFTAPMLKMKREAVTLKFKQFSKRNYESC